MKESSSVNLEKSTWQEINNYKDKLNLSSRNDALEKIILEWKMLWMFFNKNVIISETQRDIEGIAIPNKEPPHDKVLVESIEDAYDNMPD